MNPAILGTYQGVSCELVVSEDGVSITRTQDGVNIALTVLGGDSMGTLFLPYHQITAIDFKPYKFPFDGYILFHALGLPDVVGARNCFNFGDKKMNADYERIADEIRRYAHSFSCNDRQPLKASVADELTKLKDLLDAGVLTQEEFAQQKKRLLSS